MLQTSTLLFLKQLAKNNSKDWFDANRKKYEASRLDVAALVETVLQGLGKSDESITTLSAKDCMFRINRDIRFSNDKSPYKTNFGAYINPAGKNSMTAGYYLHIQPGESFVGGGLYYPDAPALKKLRQEIDYNFEEFTRIISDKKFKSVYRNGLSRDEAFTLSRPPKGYEETNPAIAFLKLKSLIAVAPLSDAQLTEKNLSSTVVKAFNALRPLIIFINKALEG